MRAEGAGRIAGDATPRLVQLIGDVHNVVIRGLPISSTVALMEERLRPHLGAADLLTPAQCEGDSTGYRQHVLYAGPNSLFSVVALVWLPGQRTPVHDHLAWCVTGVHRGEEHEQRYRLAARTAELVAAEKVVNRAGDVCGFSPPGDIHRVWNAGADKAISIHLYGVDVVARGSSVRRVYSP